MDFLSGLGNIGNAIQSGAGWLNDNSKGLGTIGSMWGAYNQYNMGNKIYGLQKDAYNYNKNLNNLAIKRQEEQDNNLANGYTNSSYMKG